MKRLLISCITLFLSVQIYAQTAYWLTDAEITNKVKAKILTDMSMATSLVRVETRDHIVILSGTVTSPEQFAKFIEFAESTEEVRDVDTTYLNVNNYTRPLNDLIITAKVKGLFKRESFFGDKSVSSANIQVETKAGVVHLHGAVETAAEAKNAIDLAASVRGVISVVSTLKIHGA